MHIQHSAYASRVELVLLSPKSLSLFCIHISLPLALFALSKMFAIRLRNVAPFVVAGLTGSAALYGYQARFSAGK